LRRWSTMSQMEIAYSLSKSIIQKVKPDEMQILEEVWNAMKPRDDKVSVKEKVLGLVGPELVNTLLWPIVVAVAARIITETLAHIAKSRIMKPKMRIEISDKVINIVHKDYAIDREKAIDVVKAVLETIDRDQDMIDKAFETGPKRVGSP
jgi:hypothetical protein